MKKRILLFITGCITLLLSSCLKTDEIAYVEIKDAQISSFILKHDSISGLANVKFTIDQISGFIYNRDSLPFGTKLDSVICSLTYSAGGVAGIQVIQEVKGDTIWWNGKDSLNFSKPVKFITTAYNGVIQKTYLASVNIHTVAPDSMEWNKYSINLIEQSVEEQKVIPYTYQEKEACFMYVKSADAMKGYELYYSSSADLQEWVKLSLTGLPLSGVAIAQITEYEANLYVSTSQGQLYSSANGVNWTLVEDTPKIKLIVGSFIAGVNQSSALAVIIEKENTLLFAGMNKSMQWTSGDVVPTNFPVSAFASSHYELMSKQRLIVVAGRDNSSQLTNASWMTVNATSWLLLSNTDNAYFEKKEGASLAVYDDKLYLLGGFNTAGKASKEIHISKDNGITWSLSDTLVVMPTDYSARGFASVLVDKNKYMLVFGGKTSANSKMLNELWCGRINRLGFKD